MLAGTEAPSSSDEKKGIRYVSLRQRSSVRRWLTCSWVHFVDWMVGALRISVAGLHAFLHLWMETTTGLPTGLHLTDSSANLKWPSFVSLNVHLASITIPEMVLHGENNYESRISERFVPHPLMGST